MSQKDRCIWFIFLCAHPDAIYGVTLGSFGSCIRYGYNSLGRLATDTTTYAYDPAGRLTALTHTHNGALLARYAYTLDAVGNRMHVTETVSGVTREISYTYDSLYRLTAADYSTGEAYAYHYDSVGNREVLTVTHNAQPTTTHYAYDAANRLTRIQLPASSFPIPASRGMLGTIAAICWPMAPSHTRTAPPGEWYVRRA